MITSYNLANGLPVFKALGSDLRVQIYQAIRKNEGTNIKQLSHELRMPMSTLSPHLQILKESGLIYLIDESTSQGKQKCCFLRNQLEQIAVDIIPPKKRFLTSRIEVPLGHYTDFSIVPPCGLATRTAFIGGSLDQPKSFADPERYHASILWFQNGYLEYALPNPVPGNNCIEKLEVSFEIGSEAPMTNNNWLSDIAISLNGTLLGVYQSPGDFGDRRGKLNPAWWFPFLNQYGLLKKLEINQLGTFLDEEPFSAETIHSLNITADSVLKLRFSVSEGAPHSGGCTLFGQGFGDHPQAIRVTLRHYPK